MRRKLLQYLSSLLLVVFLFPQAGKNLHTYLHRNDFHCASAQAHLHAPEHQCFLCDYSLPQLTYPPAAGFAFLTPVFDYIQSSAGIIAPVFNAPRFILLRAPPAMG